MLVKNWLTQKLLLLFKEVRIFYSYLWLILSLRLQFGFQIQTKFCVGNMANLKLSCLFLLWTQDKNFLETNFYTYSSKWRSPWVDTSSGRKAKNCDVGKHKNNDEKKSLETFSVFWSGEKKIKNFFVRLVAYQQMFSYFSFNLSRPNFLRVCCGGAPVIHCKRTHYVCVRRK